MSTATGNWSTGELSIKGDGDIVVARRAVRQAATQLGFSQSEVARIVTAASEIARNVYRYAGEGVMRWCPVEKGGQRAIEVRFVDHGPGIANVELALTEGYSTGGGLGMGLPGAKRLTDELEIDSKVGQGTTVILRKWRAKEGHVRN